MGDIAGSIISAGASLLGGAMNQRAQKSANRIEAWNAAMNREMQYDMANNGIKMRVEDAKRSGISPIYALGAQTTSFSPVSIGTTAATGMGDAVQNSGQHIGRAVNATLSGPEKADAYTQAFQKLSLQNQELQNMKLASEIRLANQAGSPPSMPTNTRYLIPGQGQTSGGAQTGGLSQFATDKPLERVRSDPVNTWQEGAAIPDVGYAKTRTGLSPIPSKDITDRIEDNIVHQISHWVRNNVVGGDPPRVPVPSGYDRWGYNFIKQEYQPQKKITNWGLPFDIYW